MLELAVQVDKDVFRLSVVDEKHYQLTTKDGIVDTDITAYRDSEQE
ncbi:hypothetical protein BLL52_1712 [Rhodoferax antarcticus ANT.BR]|uniref:Uncharacterized protein n=2 Tax=Rhodoferax antarcticus TaxID=81479 RepID=A0A1Q8YG13_9BURK|nr:hypothetical protein BLL52_1712 [Rhodoferax antarcticus ANT.BR]